MNIRDALGKSYDLAAGSRIIAQRAARHRPFLGMGTEQLQPLAVKRNHPEPLLAREPNGTRRRP